MYDSRCYDLARHFLEDAPEPTAVALAQEIQDAVEDWFMINWNEGNRVSGFAALTRRRDAVINAIAALERQTKT
jgi:hypothetical protein